MSYVKEPFVPGQPFEKTPEQVAEEMARPVGTLETMQPKMLDRVAVALSEEERRRANTSDAPLSFFEKLQGGLHSAYLWDDPVGYRIALEDSNRRGDSMIRGLAKAGTGLVDLANTAVQYTPATVSLNAMLTPEPTTADIVAGREPARAIEIPNITQPVQDVLTNVGVMKPETPFQRTAETLASYAGGVGALSKVPVKTFQTALPLQYASAVSGGLAESAAREGGATTGEQQAAAIITGLGVAITPSVLDLTKRLLAGGATKQQIQQAIADFETFGATPSVGIATGKPAQKFGETALANFPGGAGRLATYGEQTSEAMGTKIGAMSKELTGRDITEAATAAETAGQAVKSGAENFKSVYLGTKAGKLYDEADNVIGKSHSVSLDNTIKQLDELTAPIPALEKASAVTADPKTLELANAIKDDLAALNAPGGGAIPYESIKAFRTRIGRLIGNSSFNPEVDVQQLRNLYGALSKDIDASLANNPEALAKLKRANKFWEASQKRIDVLAEYLKKKNITGEDIYNSILRGADKNVVSVIRSMPIDAKKEFTRALLIKMGSPQQKTAGIFEKDFNINNFLKEYEKIASSKKLNTALFGQNEFGSTFASDMDAIVRSARKIRDSAKYMANTSKTSVQQESASLFKDVIGLLGIGTGVGYGAQSIVVGAGTALAAPIAANVVARIITNPKFVRWLASTSKLPPKAGAAQVDLLAKANRDDEDIQQFVEDWKQYNKSVVKPAPGPRERNGFVAEPYNPNEEQ
jgi:hypothetical protein